MRSSRVGAVPSPIGDLIDDLDDVRSRLSTLETPTGEQIDNVLPNVQANILELLTRRTLVAEQTYSELIEAGVDTIPYQTPDLAAVPFTLTERRMVHLRVTVGIGTLVVHNGTGAIYNPICTVFTRINLTNHQTGITDLSSAVTESGVGGNADVFNLARSGGRQAHDDYRTLNPGDYTAFYNGVVTQLTGTQASVLIYSPKFAVEIMEKAP